MLRDRKERGTKEGKKLKDQKEEEISESERKEGEEEWENIHCPKGNRLSAI